MNILSVDLDYFGNRGFIKSCGSGIEELMELIYNNDSTFILELYHGSLGKHFKKFIDKCESDITLISYDFHDDLAYNDDGLDEFGDNCWLGDILQLPNNKLEKVIWRYPNHKVCVEDGEGICQIAVERRNDENTENDTVEYCTAKTAKLFPKNTTYIKEERSEFKISDLGFEKPDMLFVCISEEYVFGDVLDKMVQWYTKKCLSMEDPEELRDHPNLIYLYRSCVQVLNFRKSLVPSSRTNLPQNKNIFEANTKAKNVGNNELKYPDTREYELCFVEVLDYNKIDNGFIQIGWFYIENETYEGALYNWIIEAFTSEYIIYMPRLAFRLVRPADELILASINGNANVYKLFEGEYVSKNNEIEDSKLLLF